MAELCIHVQILWTTAVSWDQEKHTQQTHVTTLPQVPQSEWNVWQSWSSGYCDVGMQSNCRSAVCYRGDV